MNMWVRGTSNCSSSLWKAVYIIFQMEATEKLFKESAHASPWPPWCNLGSRWYKQRILVNGKSPREKRTVSSHTTLENIFILWLQLWSAFLSFEHGNLKTSWQVHVGRFILSCPAYAHFTSKPPEGTLNDQYSSSSGSSNFMTASSQPGGEANDIPVELLSTIIDKNQKRQLNE